MKKEWFEIEVLYDNRHLHPGEWETIAKVKSPGIAHLVIILFKTMYADAREVRK